MSPASSVWVNPVIAQYQIGIAVNTHLTNRELCIFDPWSTVPKAASVPSMTPAPHPRSMGQITISPSWYWIWLGTVVSWACLWLPFGRPVSLCRHCLLRLTASGERPTFQINLTAQSESAIRVAVSWNRANYPGLCRPNRGFRGLEPRYGYPSRINRQLVMQPTANALVVSAWSVRHRSLHCAFSTSHMGRATLRSRQKSVMVR